MDAGGPAGVRDAVRLPAGHVHRQAAAGIVRAEGDEVVAAICDDRVCVVNALTRRQHTDVSITSSLSPASRT